MALIGLSGAGPARGAEPTAAIRFDLPSSVPCRIVPPEHPPHPLGQQLVEVRLPISLLLDASVSDALQEITYRCELSPGLEVVDYRPRTELVSRLAGPVNVEQRSEQGRHLTAAIGGVLAWATTAKVESGTDHKNGRTLRYDVAPPKEVLCTSGTWGRGRGVSFKLRPTPQTTLEGAQEFSLAFLAPASWRGGRLLLECRAESLHRGVFKHETSVSGAADFVIALYVQGDAAAQQIAEQYVSAENRLRNEAAGLRREVQRRAQPSLAYEMGVLLEIVEPRIPDQWLHELIFSPQLGPGQYQELLPPPLRATSEEYLNRKRALASLARAF